MTQCQTLPVRRLATVLPHTSASHTQDVQISADVGSYIAALRDCVQTRALWNGMCVHHSIVNYGFDHILPLSNSLLQMYGTCSTAEMAGAHFMRMPSKDLYSWNHMIRAYGRVGERNDASRAFDRMQEEGIMPNSHIFSSILCAASGEVGLCEGMQMHVRFASSGGVNDLYVGTALVSMYGKCGSFENMERVFSEIKNYDVALWNAMIAFYIQHDLDDDALLLFNKMSMEGISPTDVTYLSILSACDTPSAVKGLHLTALFHACREDSIVRTAFLNAYGKLGLVHEAASVFDDISERDSVCWNTIVNVYSQNGEGVTAIQLFSRMCQEASMWDHCSFCKALCACANAESLGEGKRIHALLSVHGYDSTMIMGNALVNMYGKCGDINNSWKMFCGALDHDVVSWNIMIAACAQKNEELSSNQLFEQMMQEGCLPNKFTMLGMVESFGKGPNTQADQHLLVIVFVGQLHIDPFVGSALVGAYGKWGQLKEAKILMSEMPRKDRSAYINFLLACAAKGVCEEGRDMHTEIVAAGFDTELSVATALIVMYGKASRIKDAWKTFSTLTKRDEIVWTAMISAFLHNKKAKDALQLFWKMQREGLKPDKVAIISILDACADDVALAVGRAMHNYVMSSVFESDLRLGTALLNLYGRCGMLEDACRVFRDLSERDIVTWSVLVAAHAQQGCAQEAHHLLEQMRDIGIEPNNVTFVGILNVCSHSGFVEEGWEWFRSMKATYGIIPVVDHYNCMIDLLARAGLMEEASTLVKEMPMSPTSSTWTTLLGACRDKQDTDRGGLAAENVFELAPSKVSPYVALSNIYTAKCQQPCLSAA